MEDSIEREKIITTPEILLLSDSEFTELIDPVWLVGRREIKVAKFCVDVESVDIVKGAFGRYHRMKTRLGTFEFGEHQASVLGVHDSTKMNIIVFREKSFLGSAYRNFVGGFGATNKPNRFYVFSTRKHYSEMGDLFLVIPIIAFLSIFSLISGLVKSSVSFSEILICLSIISLAILIVTTLISMGKFDDRVIAKVRELNAR
jgi:hypothetical protein